MIADNMDTAYFLPQLIREEIYQFFMYINKKKFTEKWANAINNYYYKLLKILNYLC